VRILARAQANDACCRRPRFGWRGLRPRVLFERPQQKHKLGRERHSMVHGECRGPVTWATPVRESLTPRAHNAGL